MSRENVDAIRDWAEGVLGRGVQGRDVADLGALTFLDPDVVYEDEILPDHVGESYHGREGFQRAWERAIEPWEIIDGRVEWVRDAGSQVVSCHFGRLRGKGSGIETEIRYAYVWSFEVGQVVHCKSYLSPKAALEAAGLSE